MLAAAALLAACTRLRVPAPGPHPLERVRVYERLDQVDVPYDVLDTVRVRLGEYGDPVNKQAQLQGEAARRGGDAVVYLTPLRNPDGSYVTYPEGDARRKVAVKALAIRLRPPPGDDARTCAALGRQLNRVRELACERAVAADPSDTASLRQLVREKRGRDDAGAVRAAERLVALRPDDAMEHVRLGCALGDDRRWPRATAEFRRAASLDTAFVAPRMILARRMADDRGAEVFPLLAYVQSLRADLPEVHLLRGRALLARGRDAEALASFDTARAMDADDDRARLGRAITLSRLGRHDEAMAEWNAVLQVRPQYFDRMTHVEEYRGERKAWQRSRKLVRGTPVATVPALSRDRSSRVFARNETSCDIVR